MVADQASNPVSLDPETAFLVPTMLLLAAGCRFPAPGVYTCGCLTSDIRVNKNKVIFENP